MSPTGTAFFLRCGRSMPVYGESLDQGRPLVRCEWTTTDAGGFSEYHGDGVTIGTRSQEEIERVMAERSDRRQRQAHERGAHDKKMSRRCPECQKAAAA